MMATSPRQMSFTAVTQYGPRAEDVVSHPVEYVVAVDRYVSAAGLGAGSRRIYRIALTTWAWAWVDRTAPLGEERRNATPPAVPLALLDTPQAALRLRDA